MREVVSEGGADAELVDSDGEVLGFENLVFAIFEFVHALVDSNKFKSAVKAGLSELMYYIVIYMQVRIPLSLSIILKNYFLVLVRLLRSSARSGVRTQTVLWKRRTRILLLIASGFPHR